MLHLIYGSAMRLHILSYNMQGLCSTKRIPKVKRILRQFKLKINLFCGQEHHKRQGYIQLLPMQLWKDVESLIVLAQDGAVMVRNAFVVFGKGGLLISVGPCLIPSIVGRGILPSNQAVWFVSYHPKLGKFGTLNVYAPTRPKGYGGCTLLWHKIFRTFSNNTP